MMISVDVAKEEAKARGEAKQAGGDEGTHLVDTRKEELNRGLEVCPTRAIVGVCACA
jgi:hypothetical protein